MSDTSSKPRRHVETRIDHHSDEWFVATSTDGVGWTPVNVPFPSEEAARRVAVAIRVGALARFE
jgi:hypothetical protein